MGEFLKNIVRFPLRYLKSKLSSRQFFILSSILVGLLSGIAAIVLKSFVHYIEILVNSYANRFDEFFLFAFFPFIGIALTVVYVDYLLKGRLRKGSAEIVYSIIKNSSIIPIKNTYSHVITSALTVGFGGSTGLESPMVSTGAAIGSNYGRIYQLSYKERTILLGCGAAAGIAAAFNSPIAGVLFAVEVLLADVTATAFIPLIISAASGALLSRIILKEGVILSFSLQQPFNYNNVPYYIILGVLAGLISLYYSRLFTYVEHKISSIPNRWTKIVLGGSLLCLLLIMFPPLFGEGYESIKYLAVHNTIEVVKNSLFQDWLTNEYGVLLFLGSLVFLKTIAAAITIGSGGNGGSFGPSLFVGAYLGYVFARIVNWTGLSNIPITNFTLVAMAGILSGVFHAPLTAIFLIAEITGGYELMIPLMIVSALSLVVTSYFEPYSMEANKLSQMLKGGIEDRDKLLLSRLDLKELIETDFSPVSPDDSMQALIKVIAQSSRNTFPVVNSDNELVGLILMDRIRPMLFGAERPDVVSVNDLMSPVTATIHAEESLHTVLRKFEETKLWNLPVVDHKNKYKGFLSKSSVLSKYRAELLKFV